METNVLYKTRACRNWEESGWCSYGRKCQFAHGAEELQYWTQQLRERSRHAGRSKARRVALRARTQEVAAAVLRVLEEEEPPAPARTYGVSDWLLHAPTIVSVQDVRACVA